MTTKLLAYVKAPAGNKDTLGKSMFMIPSCSAN